MTRVDVLATRSVVHIIDAVVVPLVNDRFVPIDRIPFVLEMLASKVAWSTY